MAKPSKRALRESRTRRLELDLSADNQEKLYTSLYEVNGDVGLAVEQVIQQAIEKGFNAEKLEEYITRTTKKTSVLDTFITDDSDKILKQLSEECLPATKLKTVLGMIEFLTLEKKQ
jgi:hypothetical protein